MREHVFGCHLYNHVYEDDHFPLAHLLRVYNPLEHIREQVFKIEIEDVYSPARGMMEILIPYYTIE
jgi:hypothetical protein